jgi:hypothetical protein
MLSPITDIGSDMMIGCGLHTSYHNAILKPLVIWSTWTYSDRLEIIGIYLTPFERG